MKKNKFTIKKENITSIKFRRSTFLLFALILGFILGLTTYFLLSEKVPVSSRYGHLKKEALEEKNLQVNVGATVDRISELMLLPAEEEPSLIILTNVESLKEKQDFFVDAEEGDHLLLYEDRAFIYRPSIERVIHIGPIIKE